MLPRAGISLKHLACVFHGLNEIARNYDAIESEQRTRFVGWLLIMTAYLHSDYGVDRTFTSTHESRKVKYFSFFVPPPQSPKLYPYTK